MSNRPPPLLNLRQEQFAAFVAEGFPFRTAYMRAHANANAKASDAGARRAMKNPRIASRISELLAAQRKIETREIAEAAQRHRVTKEYILTNLRQVCERCMTAEPILDHKGKPTGEYRFDSAGANRSLELMGRELGMFVTKVELGRPGEFERLSKLTDEELAEEMIEDMAKAQKLIEQLKSLPKGIKDDA